MTTQDSTKKSADRFPLWRHAASGRWAKKIGGRVHYFGTDRDEALRRYLAVKDDLIAGRKPRPDRSDGVRLHSLLNAYLDAKAAEADAGSITRGHLADLVTDAKAIARVFGRDRRVDDLAPDDFARLLADFRRGDPTPAASTTMKRVTRTKTIFRWGEASDIIDRAPKFGVGFKGATARELRAARARSKRKKFIPAPAIRAALDVADPQMRAAILLGINAAFTQSDLGTLRIASVAHVLDGSDSVLRTIRAKTGVERAAFIWEETRDALRIAIDERPRPRDRAHEDLIFVTPRGLPILRERRTETATGVSYVKIDAVPVRWAAIRDAAGIDVGGFGGLRTTFRSVAGAVGDEQAVRRVMAHADSSTDVDGIYTSWADPAVERDRLRRVADHVRRWFLAGGSA